MTFCLGRHQEGADVPAADIGHLCFACHGRLRRNLLDLPAVATWLAVNVAAGRGIAERVSGTRDDPIPLRVDILDLIGPDSRYWVKTATTPRYLLWDGVSIIGDYPTWRDAEVAWRQGMLHADAPQRVVDMLRRPFTREEWAALPQTDRDAMDAAHTRWQIRPTEVGGCDQRGEDAIRNRLFHWVRVTTEEGGFDWPERCDVIKVLADWLAGHLSWIAARPWVDELIADVQKATADAHRVAPWRAETRRDDEPCPSCNVRALIVHVAEEQVRCERRLGGCGRTAPATAWAGLRRKDAG